MQVTKRQLQAWSKPVADGASKAALDRIHRVFRNRIGGGIPRSKFRIYPQGSYANNTGITQSSDLDVVIEWTDMYYRQSKPPQLIHPRLQNGYFVPPNRSLKECRNLAVAKLRHEFGRLVSDDTGVAVTIRGEINLDIVISCTYRNYSGNSAEGSEMFNYIRGITVQDSHTGEIGIAFPNLHLHNGKRKDFATNGQFKRTVRIAKHFRNDMVLEGRLEQGTIPSYAIESLLYSVPDNCYGGTPLENWRNVVGHLSSIEIDQVKFQHNQFLLLDEMDASSLALIPTFIQMMAERLP